MNYKNKLDQLKKIEDHNVLINELVNFIKEIEYLEIDNYDSYFLVIDSLMLLGIEYYLIKDKNNAIDYFYKVVDFGEKYRSYSKENYFDIINCAYSWLVYYSFEDGDYKTTEKYCNIVINNYLEVKDDPNYFVTEKESVDICKKYLDEIKKNS